MNEPITDETPLQRAVRLVGGQVALAKAVGVKQQHVWNWLNRDKKLPLEWAIAIERATNGQVTAKELRPDVPVKPAPTEAA